MYSVFLSIAEHRGYFFSAIKENAKKYIKKCPDDVIRWFKDLRKAGKVLFLVTQSYIEYTRFLMEWALGYVLNHLVKQYRMYTVAVL